MHTVAGKVTSSRDQKGGREGGGGGGQETDQSEDRCLENKAFSIFWNRMKSAEGRKKWAAGGRRRVAH